MRATAGAFAIAILTPAATALAQDIYFDDSWSYTGPTKLIEGSGSTCGTAGVCARYCIEDRCANGIGHLGSDGSWWYDGEFVDGYMTGKGTWTTDFFEYTGELVKGYPHGHGILDCYTGRKFEGDWDHGKLDGEVADYNFRPCGHY